MSHLHALVISPSFDRLFVSEIDVRIFLIAQGHSDGQLNFSNASFLHFRCQVKIKLSIADVDAKCSHTVLIPPADMHSLLRKYVSSFCIYMSSSFPSREVPLRWLQLLTWEEKKERAVVQLPEIAYCVRKKKVELIYKFTNFARTKFLEYRSLLFYFFELKISVVFSVHV